MTEVLTPPSRSSRFSNEGCLQTLLTPWSKKEEEEEEEEEISVVALVVDLVGKSLARCRKLREKDLMEIGTPTDVQHVAHVTFDRFHGFLGLPVEFVPEVPWRPPSASAKVFGVSAESMQCSYDSRGNSVPTILLLMQRRLYERRGLQAEGIFRISAENSEEENVRDLLNNGIVPYVIDVHCLACLIKAWFRELPTAVLDTLRPEHVMQCRSEDDCVQVVKLLPPIEAALLDWAINLMADVVQEEHHNKMNARNIAMVFAPNMTHMSDSRTALIYLVQVLNFLGMLILKTLKTRKESLLDDALIILRSDPSDENDHQSPRFPVEACYEEAVEQVFVPEEPTLDSITQLNDTLLETCITQLSEENSATSSATLDSSATENVLSEEITLDSSATKNAPEEYSAANSATLDSSATKTLLSEETTVLSNNEQPDVQINREGSTSKTLNLTHTHSRKTRKGKSRNVYHKSGTRKLNGHSARNTPQAEKPKGIIIVRRINLKVERIEACR